MVSLLAEKADQEEKTSIEENSFFSLFKLLVPLDPFSSLLSFLFMV